MYNFMYPCTADGDGDDGDAMTPPIPRPVSVTRPVPWVFRRIPLLCWGWPMFNGVFSRRWCGALSKQGAVQVCVELKKLFHWSL